MHGVTCMEELKLPMLLYAYTGRQRYLDLDGLPSHARNGVLLGECPPPHAQFRHLHVAARPGGSHCRIRLHLGKEPAGAWNYALCPETGCKPKVVRTQTAA